MWDEKGVNTMSFKVMSIAGFGLLIAVVIALLMGRSLLGESPIPIGVQILAFLLMIWARLTFGSRSFHATANPTDGGLETAGPYHFLRHPIYAAALYFIWAGVLSHLTVINFILGLCGIAGAGLRIAAEEKLLLERYPEYAEYANRTKRIIPYLL
jgi:protein-S-isoprenylcysteine O-methyltransferase Ste14